ncbi:MAG: hypothetical protein HYW63_04050 [Candidatus Levybacteria bacterium]|nr:hypothetical protein [Candidatus Levybacteria bacterium]
MDPKLSNLDPKLQDAYNRVMSGPAAPPPPSGTVPGAVPPPPPPSPAFPPPPPPPVSPNPAPVAPPLAAEPAPAPQASSFGSTLAFNASNAGKNQGTVGVKRGGSKIMSLIILLGVIVFLAGYTVVWIYVFKLQVPYLPQF